MKTKSSMRWRTAVALIFMMLTACASHHAVKCDTRLEAINAPHAKPHVGEQK